VWDRLNKSVTELAGHSNSVNAIVFTPDDQYLISATGDYIGAEGLIKVWDVETSAEMWSMRCPRGAIALAVHPDGRQIAYGANSSVSMLDLAAGGEVEPLLVSKGDEIFDSMTFTCSGKYFIATSRAKLRVWDTGTKDLVAEFTADNPFRSCAVAPDEVTIVAGDMKGLLHFLRLEQ
jgi:WD40 repeat protein